jgi:hypothetical protein
MGLRELSITKEWIAHNAFAVCFPMQRILARMKTDYAWRIAEVVRSCEGFEVGKCCRKGGKESGDRSQNGGAAGIILSPKLTHGAPGHYCDLLSDGFQGMCGGRR